MAKTPIRCTRCGTLTTWTPYCPSCGAYLEFAGDPPWKPAPPEGEGELAEAPPSAPSESSPDEGAGVEPKDSEPKDSEPEPEDGAAGGATAPASSSTDPVAAAPQTPTKKKKPHRPAWGGVSPWWRFWARPVPTPASEATPPAATVAPPVIEEEEEIVAIVQAPAVPTTVAAESPARHVGLQKRTVPIGRTDDLGVVGGHPCPQCGFRNHAAAIYCGRCGFPLQPAVPTTAEQEVALEPSDDAPKRTDWGFLALVGVVALVILGILIAPFGEPLRSAFTSVVRSFAYWVDPDLGTPVTFASVTASSTGYGNPATALVGKDLTTFWASAASEQWGVGTTLTFVFDKPETIDRMIIKPGIQNGTFGVRALATPEGLTLTFVELSSPDDAPSPTASSGSSPATDPSATGSATPSATGPSASASGPTPTPSPSTSDSGSASPSTSDSGSPSPTYTPTPIATPSAQATLPMIVEEDSWTSVVTFPAVYTKKVVVRIDSIYPPALPDVYNPGAGGQVAISNITFMSRWTISDLFNFTFRYPAEPMPSLSPSSSPSSSATSSSSSSSSPSPSASGSTTPQQ